ncbi:MAG: GSU2403 family nucleotidyltransferase fold protein [Pseudomonadota bacterium]
METFPLAVQTAYQDLVEAHKQSAVADVGGTPFIKELGERGAYWYARRRIGDRVIDKYIGRDTAELRKRIETAQAGSQDQAAVDRRCSALVAQLRAAGAPTLDRDTGKVLNAMARIGTFRLGGTLVGTHAFRLYGAELGIRLTDTLAVTEDVDIAAFENLKLVIDDEVNPSLAETFRDLSLSPAPGLDPKHRPTRWAMSGGGAMVDFLTPKMQGRRDIVKIEPLGVYAQALSYLKFLIADPIPAVALYRNGVLVQIPRPERYAVHKLIVSENRAGSSAAKARKDRAQADLLIRCLAEDRPGELQAAYRAAIDAGPKWRQAIDNALKRAPALKELVGAPS